MSDSLSENTGPPSEEAEPQERRLFLRGMGKWSGAAIIAAVAGTWLAAPEVQAGWLNRRGGGGGWINGGGWVNRRVGGGSWINRR